MDKRLIFGLVCLFGVCLLSAQDRKSEPDKKKKRVDLLYADEAQADQQLRPDVQVLIGSVRMKHDSMYMFCDSALIYEKINSVMFVWSRETLCSYTVITCIMTVCPSLPCCVRMSV